MIPRTGIVVWHGFTRVTWETQEKPYSSASTSLAPFTRCLGNSIIPVEQCHPRTVMKRILHYVFIPDLLTFLFVLSAVTFPHDNSKDFFFVNSCVF